MADASRLELLDGASWKEFTEAPLGVLVLGKSDCAACAAWTAELEHFLASARDWRHVRFGKILLDHPGLVEFKRANPWIRDLDVLPFTQVYVNGRRSKSFAGGGLDRLLDRLHGLTAGSSPAERPETDPTHR